MSNKARFVTTVVVASVVAVGATLFISRPAAAQAPSAECVSWTPPTTKKINDWMNAQIAGGRTHFVSIDQGLCSW